MKRTLKESVYETEVHLFCGVPESHAIRLCKRLGYDVTPADDADAWTVTIGKRGVIWMDATPEPTGRCMEVLAHELGHFAFGMVRHLGLKPGDEEAFLYLQGSYLRRYIQTLFGRTKSPAK